MGQIDRLKKIVDAPDLDHGLYLFYYGFHELSRDRPVGLGPAPIPWRSMKLYCDDLELPREQRDRFYLMVGLMDQAFLKFIDKKGPKPKTKP